MIPEHIVYFVQTLCFIFIISVIVIVLYFKIASSGLILVKIMSCMALDLMLATKNNLKNVLVQACHRM